MADVARTENEVHLEDDKPQQEGQFVGATLQIDNAASNSEDPEVKFAGGFNREARPGSVYGRQSVKSTSSRTSMKPGYIKPQNVVHNYFSYKESNFDKAVGVCREKLKQEIDGNFVGAWLLTEIDHWDHEREKVVILSDSSVSIFKYHFILHKVEEWKRVLLHIIDTVAVGDFQYPKKSLMPERKHGGLQLRWNKGELLSFAQRWNPFCITIPYLTLAHHPLLYSQKESETVTYNVDEFYESVIKAISDSYKAKRPAEKVTILEGPILIESYASVVSMVYNQSSLGFFMDRNGICY